VCIDLEDQENQIPVQSINLPRTGTSSFSRVTMLERSVQYEHLPIASGWLAFSIVNTILAAIGLICVACRIIFQKLLKNNLSWDDYIILLALVSASPIRFLFPRIRSNSLRDVLYKNGKKFSLMMCLSSLVSSLCVSWIISVS
jgi:hypothetical protein